MYATENCVLQEQELFATEGNSVSFNTTVCYSKKEPQSPYRAFSTGGPRPGCLQLRVRDAVSLFVNRSKDALTKFQLTKIFSTNFETTTHGANACSASCRILCEQRILGFHTHSLTDWHPLINGLGAWVTCDGKRPPPPHPAPCAPSAVVRNCPHYAAARFILVSRFSCAESLFLSTKRIATKCPQLINSSTHQLP
jgi:hypothetical protein